MAINFTGEFSTARSAEEVYEFLCDPNQFGPLFPDFESMTVEDATHFTLKLRVGVGNIRGTAEIKMELAETLRPQRALYKGQGIAVGSQIAISTGFVLSPLPEGASVAWQGEASVSGKLAAMAGGMIEPVAQKNIQKLIDGLRWALTMPTAKPLAEGEEGGKAQEEPAVQAAPQEAPIAQQPLPPAVDESVSELGPSSGAGGVDDVP